MHVSSEPDLKYIFKEKKFFKIYIYIYIYLVAFGSRMVHTECVGKGLLEFVCVFFFYSLTNVDMNVTTDVLDTICTVWVAVDVCCFIKLGMRG